MPHLSIGGRIFLKKMPINISLYAHIPSSNSHEVYSSGIGDSSQDLIAVSHSDTGGRAYTADGDGNTGKLQLATQKFGSADFTAGNNSSDGYSISKYISSNVFQQERPDSSHAEFLVDFKNDTNDLLTGAITVTVAPPLLSKKIVMQPKVSISTSIEASLSSAASDSSIGLQFLITRGKYKYMYPDRKMQSLSEYNESLGQSGSFPFPPFTSSFNFNYPSVLGDSLITNEKTEDLTLFWLGPCISNRTKVTDYLAIQSSMSYQIHHLSVSEPKSFSLFSDNITATNFTYSLAAVFESSTH